LGTQIKNGKNIADIIGIADILSCLKISTLYRFEKLISTHHYLNRTVPESEQWFDIHSFPAGR